MWPFDQRRRNYTRVISKLEEDMEKQGVTLLPYVKDKDLVELKRAVSKLRKTCEAIDGDIAGFGEDYVVAVPYFARIHRNSTKLDE